MNVPPPPIFQAAKSAGGPTRMEDAKIALIQFQISPPKTDIENNVIVSDYNQVRAACTALGVCMSECTM